MEIDVHGKKVHVKSISDSARHAAKYLQDLEKDEAHNYFEVAKLHGSSHFETPRHTHDRLDNLLHHDMTLIHNPDGSYDLRKRSK